MTDCSRSPPTYRLHKQSGQAVVALPDALGQLREVVLGKHVTMTWETGGVM